MSRAKPTCHTHVPVEAVFYPAPAGMERAVVFEPGYICPVRGGKGHGRHGMNIRWLLRGPKGVAQFLLYTGWLPGQEHVDIGSAHLHPCAADLGYHARVQQYEGQEPMGGPCEYLADGAPCFYDGSGLAARDLFITFLALGEEALWSGMAERYIDLIAPTGYVLTGDGRIEDAT